MLIEDSCATKINQHATKRVLILIFLEILWMRINHHSRARSQKKNNVYINQQWTGLLEFLREREKGRETERRERKEKGERGEREMRDGREKEERGERKGEREGKRDSKRSLPIMVIIHTMRYEKRESQTRDRIKVTMTHFLHRVWRQSGTVRYRRTLMGTDTTNTQRPIALDGISNTEWGSSVEGWPKENQTNVHIEIIPVKNL